MLALVLTGTGSKAGLVPLHVWLPLAHPAAPSHVSALMSGVMTKVAIYGFVRIVFDLLGPPAWWWSLPVLALGSITAVLGVLFALMQRDLKRLLAFSTIENIGIVFIGLGLALAFKANGMAAAAALALTAALFHVLNHSLFKSILFFVAGAILTATGERDIEKLGGLIHRMPHTTVACLGGCLAISALPPLNGFVSEWLLFQSILLSPDLPQWALKLMVPATGAMLALGAALSAACFVRAFGIAFLGPATDPTRRQRARDRRLLACGHVGAPRRRASPPDCCPGSSSMPYPAWCRQTSAHGCRSRPRYPGCRSCRSPKAEAPTTVCSSSRSSRSRPSPPSRSSTTSHRRRCAVDRPGIVAFPIRARRRNTPADSFAQPVRRVFSDVFLARETVDMPPPGDPRPARLGVHMRDLVWDVLYAPISGWIAYCAEKLNHLQFLTIRSYLSLVFASLVLLLLTVAIWP